MRSVAAPAILMIVLGALALYPMGGAPSNLSYGTPVTLALGALLIVGGVLIFLRVRPGYYVGLFAALATAISGLAVKMGHPTWGLPFQWGVSVAVGLYLTVRVLMLIPTTAPPKPPTDLQSPPSA